MKKFFKILSVVLIDIISVYLLGTILLFFVNCFYSPKYEWIYYLLVIIGYLLFSFFNRWKTIGVKIVYDKKDENKPSFFSILFSIIVDLFVVFSFTILIDKILIQFVYFDTLLLFWIIAPLYYIISYCFSNRTIGKYLFGFKINKKIGESNLPLKEILKREFIKFGVGFWIPLSILYFICNFTNLYVDFIIILVVNLIFLLFYFTAKNETWWETLTKTQKIRTTKPRIIIYPIFLLFVLSVFFTLQIYNNINNKGTDKILGFNVPFKRIEHPDNNKVEPYYKFLKEKGQNPKDYILDLFDKYDIVVLCENLHPEDTQWDFIYDFVSDERFYGKVNHIFTEYGCVWNQCKVEDFMQTKFDSDSALHRATATLMDYHSGNFYFFMEKLYKLNQTLPDSLKITEHFTDAPEWEYLEKAYYDTLCSDNRDSLMAQVVIDFYNKEKKKCLVITNYRHAFMVNNNNKIHEYFADNEAQYIYNNFLEQAVNVMLFGSSFHSHIIFKPINNGVWNTALKKTGYTPVGFNFENSPFGQDYFDKFPYFFQKYPYTYADVFNGFVFYKPEEEFTYSKQPFKRYAAEEEYKFAKQNNLIDTVIAKQLINNYDNEGGAQYVSLPFDPFSIYHFVDLLIWFVWGLFVCLILIIKLPIQLVYNQKTNNQKLQ